MGRDECELEFTRRLLREDETLKTRYRVGKMAQQVKALLTQAR